MERETTIISRKTSLGKDLKFTQNLSMDLTHFSYRQADSTTWNGKAMKLE